MMGWGDEAFGNGDLTPITHDTWKQKQEAKTLQMIEESTTKKHWLQAYFLSIDP